MSLDALNTLAYYDVLDIALNASEVERLCGKGATKTLSGINQRDGYFYLFDREYLVPLRQARQRIAKHKWRRLRWATFWLRFVPFIRLVFASGSLSMENTDEASDLDIVVVAKQGHIWTVRFLVAVVLTLLGMRRKHHDHEAPNKICPNHFMTDQSLEIPFHSMYTAHLYLNLIPLLAVDYDDLKKFREANRWVLDYLPVGRQTLEVWQMRQDKIMRQGLSFGVQWLGEIILGWTGGRVERFLADYQKNRIEAKTNSIQPGGHLVYNDRILAFHLESSEARILKTYNENIKNRFK